MMSYEETKEFKRDFKKLLRKFPSLSDDLKSVKKNSIELLHFNSVDNKGIFKIRGVTNTDKLQFFKIKKFACKSLKGRGAKSGIRIIYAFIPQQEKVVFIEIYFKAKQENENKQRIAIFKQEKS